MTVFVVSAPSGAGKTTLNRRLLKECPQLAMSISCTTRAPRPGEKDGDHYHFVTREAFQEMIDKNQFIEWAEVHGQLYGTPIEELHRIENLGKHPILEIDVQGWKWARSRLPQALSIFILPPTLHDLWERLERRGSDHFEQRWLRFQNGLEEIQNAGSYQVFLVNREIDATLAELKSLVQGAPPDPASQREGLRLCEQLNEEYRTADWIQQLRQNLGSKT